MNALAAGVQVSGRAPLAARSAADVVREVLRRERRQALISLAFVGRDRMRRLNRAFRGRPATTDVLAFPLPGPSGLAGDIYVCPWVARREARRRSITAREELIRYIVHGTLHVLGYDHPEQGRESCAMWRRQERYVKALA